MTGIVAEATVLASVGPAVPADRAGRADRAGLAASGQAAGAHSARALVGRAPAGPARPSRDHLGPGPMLRGRADRRLVVIAHSGGTADPGATSGALPTRALTSGEPPIGTAASMTVRPATREAPAHDQDLAHVRRDRGRSVGLQLPPARVIDPGRSVRHATSEAGRAHHRVTIGRLAGTVIGRSRPARIVDHRPAIVGSCPASARLVAPAAKTATDGPARAVSRALAPRCRLRRRSPTARSSWLAVAPWKKRSWRAGRRIDCWSSRNGELRSRRSFCTRPTCASRSSRSRGVP